MSTANARCRIESEGGIGKVSARRVFGHVVMAYVVTNIVMADIGMAYAVMAYLVMVNLEAGSPRGHPLGPL